MCGTFAYSGPKNNAGEIVVQGLKKLEYRGYDSWGIAFSKEQKIDLIRKVGKIGEFNLEHNKIPESTLAIGHSRWATHGGVTEANAHPHVDEERNFAVVHNGIIENYRELREELQKKGYTFKSETDTETIVHLIADYAKEDTFVVAARKALKRLKGRFAMLVIKGDEQKIIAARRGSPLIIGVGDGEFFIASDIPAFLQHTRKVMYIDDNEMVVVNDKPHFYNFNTGEEVQKRIVEINWEAESAEKGDFEHFMLKEISEQKDTIYRAINQND
ncbi:MAG TPA: class II glutamine amidotransferase, partial [Candidatus Gracilibacteria bacterium]|nr:class II glutamine amidotransferase [Candidatus Gracilibacteria bacterium]